MPNRERERIHGYYVRDDGELMIEMRPGEFVSETAVRRGLVHPNILVEIDRINARLRRRPPHNPKPRP